MMSDRSIRKAVLAAATLGALLLLALLPGTAQALEEDEFGWAVVRKPGSLRYRIRDPKDYASSGDTVRVRKLRRGHWNVTFRGVDGTAGSAHVTPLTSGAGFCRVVGWDGAPAVVEVTCHGRGGPRADIGFIVNFIHVHSARGQFAYVWANKPSTAEYNPDATYSHNADGALNVVKRSDVGRYVVVLTAGPSPGGSVQVSAYGEKRRHCRTLEWGPSGADELIPVYCSSKSGHFADSMFTLTFYEDLGLRANSGGKWAYLLANRPKAASYVPQARYRGAKPSGKPRVLRSSRGRYVVKLPSMPLGGAVQVTPMDSRSRRCNVAGIRKGGKPQRIEVRCYNATGTKPKDSAFTLSYTK